MAYTRSFISLRGTAYTVNVQGVSPTYSPPLADNPFETQEDDEADMFMPVRTQSGYLRLQSDGNANLKWREFVPGGVMAMPVTLKQGSTVVWQGYVQTGTYGMTYPSDYEQIELPLVCPLTVLDSLDYDATWPSDFVTIGQLLSHIFGKLTGLTLYFCFHVPSSTTYRSVDVWLTYQVLWRNFVDESGAQRFSCLGLLEELCKFFGWTCRCQGDCIYFTSITDTLRNARYIRYTVGGLANPLSGYTYVSMNSLAVGDGLFANTDQTEEVVPGIKSVTIKSELNPYDVLVSIPYSDIQKQYRYDTPEKVERWRDGLSPTEVWVLKRAAVNYDDQDVSITSFVESAVEGSPQCYGRLIILDTNTDEPKLKYAWTTMFETFHSEDYGNRTSGTPLFSVTSKQSFVVSSGMLYIDGTTDLMYTATTTKFRAVCTLRIGNQYWNGSAWTTTVSTFTLFYDQDGIQDTRQSVSEPEYEGTGIPVTTGMTGQIYFAVNDVYPANFTVVQLNGYFPIKDFKIGFIRADEDEEANDVEYKVTAGSFPETVTLDTIFATEKTTTIGSHTRRCQLGYGLLFMPSASGAYVTDTIPYGGSAQNSYKPERRTAQLIANYGVAVKQVETVNLRTDLIGLSIGPLTRVTFGSLTYYPIAVGHQWIDDITTIKLMQI